MGTARALSGGGEGRFGARAGPWWPRDRPGESGTAACPRWLVASGHDAAAAGLDHPLGHGLGEEEDRPVQLEVGVVERAVVVQERLGDEKPGRVDQ